MGSTAGTLYAKNTRLQFPRNHFQTLILRHPLYVVGRCNLDWLLFFSAGGMARLVGYIYNNRCIDRIMKSCFVLAIVLVMYTNGCCKETEDDGVYNSLSNLTLEEDDDDDDFSNFMRPQQFTWGTLLGLLVASVVVVIGSFLVLWRVCCDVEMRVTREVVMEPLKSISQAVAGGQSGSISGQALLGRRASTGVLEIA